MDEEKISPKEKNGRKTKIKIINDESNSIYYDLLTPKIDIRSKKDLELLLKEIDFYKMQIKAEKNINKSLNKEISHFNEIQKLGINKSRDIQFLEEITILEKKNKFLEEYVFKLKNVLDKANVLFPDFLDKLQKESLKDINTNNNIQKKKENNFNNKICLTEDNVVEKNNSLEVYNLMEENKKLKNKIKQLNNELEKLIYLKEKKIDENSLTNKLDNYIKNNNKLIEENKQLKKYISQMNEIQKNSENYLNEINRLRQIIKEKELIENNEKKINKEEKIKLIEKNKELEEKIKEKQNIYDKLLIEIEEKREELINGPQPILVGLNNIGATCFMNSTLQCLSQTKALTDFFLNKKNEDKIINNNIAVINKNDLQLSPIYAQLIKKLWDKNGPKSFSPNEFRSIVEKMNPLFKQGQAGDSKDFIIFILEQIHKELKKPNPNKNQNTVQTLNQYDKANALSYFFNDFQDQLSIISDTFFGINETTNECINCKNNYNLQGYYNNPICYNYGIFNLLIFPLEEVKNMRNNNIQYYGYNNGYNNFPNNEANRVSLYECFCYNQKVELFTGENRNYCNICKQLYDSNYVSKIYTCPNILILILNRGRNNIYDVKLDFAETIDITQFVLQPDKPRMIYNLYGVITHIGQSGPNAHFIASCKSQINNKWYRFNDAFVTPITDFQKEIHDFSTPYILFYQKS